MIIVRENLNESRLLEGRYDKSYFKTTISGTHLKIDIDLKAAFNNVLKYDGDNYHLKRASLAKYTDLLLYNIYRYVTNDDHEMSQCLGYDLA